MTAATRVLVAMSGGVDSSVAAALLRDAGHDVTGVTLKLWGGESDSGCCSAAGIQRVTFGWLAAAERRATFGCMALLRKPSRRSGTHAHTPGQVDRLSFGLSHALLRRLSVTMSLPARNACF